jgi:large subunit ribosomal protein L6
MSKVGKKPIVIPQGVQVDTQGGYFTVKGPKGELKRPYPEKLLTVKVEGDVVTLSPASKSERALVNWGTFRSHLFNMVHGVSEGWKKTLELVGVGYRAEIQGKDLVLAVGFSHPVKIACPEGITFKLEKSIITVEGQNKELVGEISDKIRSVRPPEPYKGKGIKYTDEVVRRKAGKAAKTQA